MSNDPFGSSLARPVKFMKGYALRIVPLIMIGLIGLIFVVALGLTQGWKAAVVALVVTIVVGVIYGIYLLMWFIRTGTKTVTGFADDATNEMNRPGQVPPASTHDWTNGGDYFNEGKPTDIKP